MDTITKTIKAVDVTNKSAGNVVYRTSHGQRVFEPGQTRHDIPIDELKELVSTRGGAILFYNYLYVNEQDLTKTLLDREPEPEYWLTEDKIPEWMNTCSLAEFKDALDFAPSGTKDLIKKYAVELPLNDYNKRKAIFDQLGLDVTRAIENMAPDEETKTEDEPRGEDGRRASATPTGTRRAKITITGKTS